MREYKPLEPWLHLLLLAGWSGCVHGMMGTSCGQRREVQFLFDLFPELNPATRSSCANKQ